RLAHFVRGQKPWACNSELFLPHMPLLASPSARSVARQVTRMSPSMTAYSTAVAASSPVRNSWIAFIGHSLDLYNFQSGQNLPSGHEANLHHAARQSNFLSVEIRKTCACCRAATLRVAGTPHRGPSAATAGIA